MKEPRNLGLSTQTHTLHTGHTQPREIGWDSSGSRPARTKNERAAPPRMYKISPLSGNRITPLPAALLLFAPALAQWACSAGAGSGRRRRSRNPNKHCTGTIRAAERAAFLLLGCSLRRTADDYGRFADSMAAPENDSLSVLRGA